MAAASYGEPTLGAQWANNRKTLLRSVSCYYSIGVPFHSSLPVLLVFKAVQGITDLVDLFLSHLLASTNVNNLSISEALKELKQYILIVFAEPFELFL